MSAEALTNADTKLFVGGKHRDGRAGQQAVVDPGTGREIVTVAGTWSYCLRAPHNIRVVATHAHSRWAEVRCRDCSPARTPRRVGTRRYLPLLADDRT
jgi:hypothetical protein